MFDDIDLLIASPAELLESVADMEPGLLAMSVLMMIDPSQLDAEDAITFLQAHERISAWWASVQARAIVAAASPERLVDEFTLLDPRPEHDEERTIRIEDAVREELAAAVRWSPAMAQDRIDSARLLAGPLRATHESLSLGEITSGHVSVIVEAACRLPGRFDDAEQFEAACSRLQDRVLPCARRGTLSSTRAAARRAVLAIDAEGARRRRLAARCMRSVYVVDEADGLSTLIARMSTEAAHAVFSAIDAHAQESDATGLIGERRAEALAELILSSVGKGGAPVRAHLDIVIGLDDLLGLGDSPAELLRSGPILSEVVRELLSDPKVECTMRRLIADPITGHLIDVGRRSYEIPEALRRFIQSRDRACRFPACRRAAAKCQIDHATAWDDDGGTDLQNLGALCVRHHQLKTHAGWRITESRPDGSCSWESPQGRTYEHPPQIVRRR